jgi:DNA-binding NtrC family response regulator
MLDVCDFPQIAAAMGVEMRPRQTLPLGTPLAAPVSVIPPELRHHHATSHEPIYQPASPYVLSTTDGAGHMRKLEEVEAEIIRLAISRYEGHMSEVARRLGIGRSTLYRKLKELGLEPHVEDGEEPEQRAAG